MAIAVQCGLVCILLALGLSSAHGTPAKTKGATKAKANVSQKSKYLMPSRMPELLTTRQLLSLKPASRAKYLREVGKALAQLELMQTKMLGATPRRSAMADRLRDIIAQITWMDSAYAQASQVGTGIPTIVVGADGKASLKCEGTYFGQKVVVNPHLRSCELSEAPKRRITGYKCPEGFEPVTYQLNKLDRALERDTEPSTPINSSHCIASSSFDKFSESVKDSLRARWMGAGPTVRSRVNSFESEEIAQIATSREALKVILNEEQTTALLTAGAASVPDEALAAGSSASGPRARPTNTGSMLPAGVLPQFVDGKWKCTNNNYEVHPVIGTCVATRKGACLRAELGRTISTMGELFCVPESSFQALSKAKQEVICPPTGPSAQSPGVRGEQCAFVYTGVPLTNLTDIGAVDEILGGFSEGQQAQLIKSLAPSTSTTGVPAGGSDCEWKALTCPESESEKESAIQSFYKYYNDNPAAAGQSFGALCMYSGNFSTYPKNKPVRRGCQAVTKVGNLSCGGGQVICNPLVFGVRDEGGGPLCVKRDGAATASCATLKNNEGGKDVTQELLGFDNEAWESLRRDFKRGLENYCYGGDDLPGVNPGFNLIFCSECNTIGETVARAQNDLRGEINFCVGEAASGGGNDAGASGTGIR